MTTSEINNQRLDTVREPIASLLLELTRRFVFPQNKLRTVQPPVDFAQAIAEVLTPDRVPAVRNMADCEDEHIGEEFSTRPFLW